MSWKPEFEVDGRWYDNALRFATRNEAAENACDKFMAWSMPTAYRATESPDPVNYRYVDHQLVAVEEACPDTERNV